MTAFVNKPVGLVELSDLLEQFFRLVGGEVELLNVGDANAMFLGIVVSQLCLHRVRPQ